MPPERLEQLDTYVRVCRDRAALEIGGPSGIFGRNGLIPLYPVLRSIDGCNFDTRTVWQPEIVEGPGKYLFDTSKEGGHQFVLDAVRLEGIPAGSYDVVTASHCLEHIANPLQALTKWVRVTRPGGYLLLVLPHKDGTFDHRRPVTTLEHLVEDFRRSVGEDDLTHLPEILELHDLSMDPPAGDMEAFHRRSLDNFQNRCLHHHVFDTELVVRVVDHLNLQTIDLQQLEPFHIVCLAQNPPAGARADNGRYLTHRAAYRSDSPFASDRKGGGS